MNATDLTAGTTVIEHRRIGRTRALGLRLSTVREVDHHPRITHYQLAQTGEVRAAAPDTDIATHLPDHAITVAFLPAHGSPHIVTIDPTVQTLRALVGGDPYGLPLARGQLWVREDARDFDAVYNPVASRLVQAEHRHAVIYGDVVLHGRTGDDGRPTSVPAAYVARLSQIGAPS